MYYFNTRRAERNKIIFLLAVERNSSFWSSVNDELHSTAKNSNFEIIGKSGTGVFQATAAQTGKAGITRRFTAFFENAPNRVDT